MTEPEPHPSPPPPPPFQFILRTLLLLFVVLGSSLAVFGAWGIVVFGLVVGLAIYLHQVESLWSMTQLALVVLCLLCLAGPLIPAVATSHVAGMEGVDGGVPRTRPCWPLYKSTWIGTLRFAVFLTIIIVPGETQDGGSSGSGASFVAPLHLHHGWPWPYLNIITGARLRRVQPLSTIHRFSA